MYLSSIFNNKNASLKPDTNEAAIRNKYFQNGKAIPPMSLDEFRAEAKKHLNDTLISIKTKNKVVTINLNRTKKKNGINKKAATNSTRAIAFGNCLR